MYATAKTYEIIHADTRYCTLLSMGCSFITLRERVQLFNRLTRKTVV